KAPHLVRKEDLARMKDGSVVVDVAIDQGGCVETSRPTTHSDPTFVVDGVTHYCVANMPGAVSRTSTFALCNATFPWVQCMANEGIDASVANHAAIAHGLNMYRGAIVNRAVAESFGLPYDDRFAGHYWS
ncbi:MAG TPA: alanine dehydrogenase, partial [Planctomycetaceae bacterium]|nr:alanine dehydrogenase [Planctomycetaceae bacterium]